MTTTANSITLNRVRRGSYLDSVALMRLSRSITERDGVLEAALMMGTPANKAILKDAGLLVAEGEGAAANDLVLAVRAVAASVAEDALLAAETALDRPQRAAIGTTAVHPRTLRGALRVLPDATLALISVPGDFAMGEARAALRSGLDVMIFSDNVPLEDEVAIKREARERSLLVMGPDCGTAIINGAPIAFANRVPRGDVGIVGASGTGMQEVSCLLAPRGRGISQALGVGGRDLSREVGALSTLMAIDRLDADPDTRHIVLISKPPHPEVARAVLARVAQSCKRFTACFLGATGMDAPANASIVGTLRATAEDVLGRKLVGGAEMERTLPTPRRGGIVGLFSGGTLAAEAQLILKEAGRDVASNAPVPGVRTLTAERAAVDCILDLGADEFTRGRPHPMIEPAVRADMLAPALADANIATILLDLVIGYGAHADPSAAIVAALAGARGEGPHVVASVIGTESDPQIRSRQVAALASAGVIVATSNAHAAELALRLSS